MYIYCVVCYRVIEAPYVRSVGHVFVYQNTLWTVRLLYPLKFFLHTECNMTKNHVSHYMLPCIGVTESAL